MTSPFKFGHGEGPQARPYRHPHRYEIERTKGPLRLAIGPSGGHIHLLAELAREIPEPIGLLYVLVVPRTDREPGRYQSPLLRRNDLDKFLDRFREFFEGDGRHHLWVLSPRGGPKIVYDRHDVLYAYGPIEVYERVLRALRLSEDLVEIPVPHVHMYHQQYDSEEKAVLNYWDWKRSPLVEGVDDL